MSKMMDNLAQVSESEDSPPRPALFVVKGQAPGTAFPAAGRGKKKILVAWLVVAVGVMAVAIAYYFETRRPHATVPTGALGAAKAVPAAYKPLLEAGRYQEAIQELDAKIISGKGNWADHANRALALKELGKLDEAETEYLELLKESPRNPLLLNNLGALYLRAGKTDHAESTLRDALRESPDSVEIRINLAGALEKKRVWPEALKLFESVLEDSREQSQIPLLRERVRRLRSLAASTTQKKEDL